MDPMNPYESPHDASQPARQHSPVQGCSAVSSLLAVCLLIALAALAWLLVSPSLEMRRRPVEQFLPESARIETREQQPKPTNGTEPAR